MNPFRAQVTTTYHVLYLPYSIYYILHVMYHLVTWSLWVRTIRSYLKPFGFGSSELEDL